MKKLQSTVWELLGLTRTRSGILTLDRGVLKFETDEGVRFQSPLTQITQMKWPWYSFNAGLNLTVNGVKFRFSFARPNGAGAAWLPDDALQGLFDLGGAIKTGKAWRAKLEAETAASMH